MPETPLPEKYAPLVANLTARPPTTSTVTLTLTLTLTEIEQLLGTPLPAGAWAWGWWQSRQDRWRRRPWLAAGWRVAGTAMRTRTPTVTFDRVTSATTAVRIAPPRPAPAENGRQHQRGDRRIAD